MMLRQNKLQSQRIVLPVGEGPMLNKCRQQQIHLLAQGQRARSVVLPHPQFPWYLNRLRLDWDTEAKLRSRSICRD